MRRHKDDPLLPQQRAPIRTDAMSLAASSVPKDGRTVDMIDATRKRERALRTPVLAAVVVGQPLPENPDEEPVRAPFQSIRALRAAARSARRARPRLAA
jgi:hypothetical protein